MFLAQLRTYFFFFVSSCRFLKRAGHLIVEQSRARHFVHEHLVYVSSCDIHVREGAHVSSANLHLPQKALFSKGQCPIKESVLLRACVCVWMTVCSVSTLTCCQRPEVCSRCISPRGSVMFLLCFSLSRRRDDEMLMRLAIACNTNVPPTTRSHTTRPSGFHHHRMPQIF